MRFLFITLLFLFKQLRCDSIFISTDSSVVSTTTSYSFFYFVETDLTPVVGSNFSITLPSEYASRLTNGNTTCTVTWSLPITVPSVSCSLSDMLITVQGLFSSAVTFQAANGDYFDVRVDNILNPYSAVTPGNFIARTTVSGGTITATGQVSSPFSAGSMTCSIATSPT